MVAKKTTKPAPPTKETSVVTGPTSGVMAVGPVGKAARAASHSGSQKP